MLLPRKTDVPAKCTEEAWSFPYVYKGYECYDYTLRDENNWRRERFHLLEAKG